MQKMHYGNSNNGPSLTNLSSEKLFKSYFIQHYSLAHPIVLSMVLSNSIFKQTLEHNFVNRINNHVTEPRLFKILFQNDFNNVFHWGNTE